MAKREWLVSFLFILVATGCSEPDPRSPPRAVNVEQGYVTFEGRWRVIADRVGVHMPKLNTISGVCRRNTKTCEESVAKLFRKSEWLRDRPGYLIVTTTEFEIVEWSSARIVARYEAPVADLELRLSLSDLSVERSFRETKARGSDTADPKNAGHWVLE
jgi:hypothetical protein